MRVFSGIQPSGEIHIGNYLGALKQWIQLQEKNECVFCIVDLHSITVPYDIIGLKKRILEKAIAYLAAGLDPKKVIIFVQSQVPEHTELSWLLSTITPIGDLLRMTQYKEKSKKHPKNINAGLLNYPILMAADILLYQTEAVPIGKDQSQHVELTREIARRFNQKFGQTFKIPKVLLPKKGAKIMSLTEPKKKMSKTDSPQSCIFLFEEPEMIRKKIMTAQTDSGKQVKYKLSLKPGISNLLTIYSAFSDVPIAKIEKEFKNKGYQVFKEKLAQLLIEKLEPFRRKKKELENQQALLEKILEAGRKRAQIIAFQTMEKVRKNMGFRN
ncbi:tryptophan--tRNA ligase [bacterium (Candidatus Gribaldobacteria) CG_4_9_14_3_um_filter_36_15]|uniref:Tryptophan--tRNA ligase n=1 Tax=bacterium (Candidatus Gribaldobacteria) CG_4_9_14_3_um_filter_36_15 TaxID=2014269 RepID=A0A2M7ZVJ6_9BACT|nr:MAG: tryptophan--tRNA ligase [bacterium (Candidatus Gribaldobacteria) CG_4_9_14_3_um_filter_36_15]